jgi:hypothetical protein
MLSIAPFIRSIFRQEIEEADYMGHYSMENPRLPGGLMAFAFLLVTASGLAACDRAQDSRADAPTATVAPNSPVPPASSVTDRAAPGTTANANDQPMKSMTKEEESSSMPRPGQANDDSTLAKDPGK